MEERAEKNVERVEGTMIRVLIIDDEQDKIDAIYSTVKSLKVDNIDISKNVIDSISLLKNHKYDVVLLDLNLPIKHNSRVRSDSGLSILKMLCEGGMNVPNSIIGLTSYDKLYDQYRRDFQELDFSLYDFNKSEEWGVALKNKIKWVENFNCNVEIPENRKVIITVHGIRTSGVWQDNLGGYIENSGGITYNYKAKYLSALKILIPIFRDGIERSFSNDFDIILRKHPGATYYVFAHSFGTYLVAKKLEKMQSVNVPEIKYLVLAGSVLRRDFNWKKILEKLPRMQVVNDCGVNDIPLVFAEVFGPGLGMAGRRGFFGFENSAIINRYFSGGHNFFEEKEGFYNENWIPLLSDEVTMTNVTVNAGLFFEVKENILDNIKWIFWVSVISFFVYTIC